MALARAGAYLGGTRRVSPRRRGRWASSFHEHLTAARGQASTTAGAAAYQALIELAIVASERSLFEGSPPVRRLRLSIPAQVATLWDARLRARGLTAVADELLGQLVRWERPRGWGAAHAEEALAEVLAVRLPTMMSWEVAAAAYERALDRAARRRALVGGPDGATLRHLEPVRGLRARLRRFNELLALKLPEAPALMHPVFRAQGAGRRTPVPRDISG